jgi:hypothetical protein
LLKWLKPKECNMRNLNLEELQAVAGGADQKGPTVTESAAVGGGIGGAVGASVVAESAGGWAALAGGTATLPATAGTTITLFSTAGAGLAVEGWTAYQIGGAWYDRMAPDTQMSIGQFVSNQVDSLIDTLVSVVTGMYDRGNVQDTYLGPNDGPLTCGMMYR